MSAWDRPQPHPAAAASSATSAPEGAGVRVRLADMPQFGPGVGITPPRPDRYPVVMGSCPACRGRSLFLGAGGHVTCSRIDCPNPTAVDEWLHTGRVLPGRGENAVLRGPRVLCEETYSLEDRGAPRPGSARGWAALLRLLLGRRP